MRCEERIARCPNCGYKMVAVVGSISRKRKGESPQYAKYSRLGVWRKFQHSESGYVIWEDAFCEIEDVLPDDIRGWKKPNVRTTNGLTLSLGPAVQVYVKLKKEATLE